MKKVLLVLAALMLVSSGVAAVSAYEAHVINVKAHVENAMEVRATAIDFGTVFPEEWWIKEFTLGTSNSFCAGTQQRVTKIDYSIWVEWKPIPGTAPVEYYPWLGDALYVGIDVLAAQPKAADLVPVGGPPPGAPGTSALWVMDAPIPLHKKAPYNFNDTITVGLDVPVFEGYYNELTDMLQADGTYLPKPSGLNAPTLVIAKTDPRWIPIDGVDLGLDLKIQVTNIWKP